MIRQKIRKRILRLNDKAKEYAQAGDVKKAAEMVLRIDECEQILKMI